MLNQPEPACLVIADISGYTGFLAGAELDHAQDILADLMATVVALDLSIQSGLAALAPLIEASAAEARAAAAGEPDVPAGLARNVSEPIVVAG